MLLRHDGVGHEHGQGEMGPDPPYGFILVHEDRGGTIKFNAGKAADAVLAYVAAAVAEAAGRCLETGHPWGTDTRPVGYRCPCASCKAVVKQLELLKAAVPRAVRIAVL